jgi:hypothetical protein
MRKHEASQNIIIGFNFRGEQREREFIPNGDAFKGIEFRFLPRNNNKLQAIKNINEVITKLNNI